MTALALCRYLCQRLVRWGWVVQKREEKVAIPVRQGGGRFFSEANVVLGNDLRLADPQFCVTDLLDQDRRVGKGLRQAHPGFVIRGAGQGGHGDTSNGL